MFYMTMILKSQLMVLDLDRGGKTPSGIKMLDNRLNYNIGYTVRT